MRTAASIDANETNGMPGDTQSRAARLHRQWTKCNLEKVFRQAETSGRSPVSLRPRWISSANLDMRSITLNFEIAAVFYEGGCALQLAEYFDRLAAHSRPLRLEEVTSTGARAVGESVLRLLSPLI